MPNKTKRVAGNLVPADYEQPGMERPPLQLPPGPIGGPRLNPVQEHLVEVLHTYRCRACGFLSPVQRIVEEHVAEHHPPRGA